MDHCRGGWAELLQPTVIAWLHGLGEYCTHVVSLLFAIEGGIHIRDSLTVTQKKGVLGYAHWCKRGAPVKDISFCEKKQSASMMESLQYSKCASHTMSALPEHFTSPGMSASTTPNPSVCSRVKLLTMMSSRTFLMPSLPDLLSWQ